MAAHESECSSKGINCSKLSCHCDKLAASGLFTIWSMVFGRKYFSIKLWHFFVTFIQKGLAVSFSELFNLIF